MTALPIEAPALASSPRLTIDLTAVAANTRTLADATPGELMAVVKADGFGLGAAAVARTALLHGATRLGVTSLSEAFALRDAGLRAPVLSWLNPVEAAWRDAVHEDVDVAVPSLAHLDAVARTGSGARVHLHLDVDMARDGAAPQEWIALCAAARAWERAGRLRVVGLMGHLGCADDPGHVANAWARRRFTWGLRMARGAGLRPVDLHLAATAATLHDPQAHHTMSRVGAGLVGIDPSRRRALRGAVRLTAPVVGVREVRPGTAVGYGHTWFSDRRTRLVLVPLGYADGLPRSAAPGAEVLVNGRRCPVVGRISMDMVVVDVGDLPVRLGDKTVVLGPGDDGEPTTREWADWAGTIEHEVLCGLGHRAERHVVGADVVGVLA